VITIMFLHPSDSGSSVIKSMDISDQIRSGIGSGFRKPFLLDLYDLFWPQPSQASIKSLISFDIPGQKN
jgi:hypothetical protein